MPIRMFDELVLDAVRRTPDGYLAANVKAARTGIQEYSGAEVGRPDLAKVRVYRAPDEVFNRDAMHSFAWRPVTVDHPQDAVTADNWKQFAVGMVGDEVARDGEAIRVPLVLMDAAAIARVEGGKREISMGYTCDLVFQDGQTGDGLKYDAIQTNIRANHLAIVTTARGGPSLRIDAVTEDRDMPDTPALKVILVDGLQVQTTDAGAAAIEKLLKNVADLGDKLVKADAAATAAATTASDQIKAKDAEIADLKKQIVSGAALDTLIIARGTLIANAKKIAGDDFKADGLSDVEIRKAAVTKKLGDAKVAGKEPAWFDAIFDHLAAEAPQQTQQNNPARDAFRAQPNGGAAVTDEAEKAWDKANEDQANAWRGKAA